MFRSGRRIARGPLVLHVPRGPRAGDLSTSTSRVGFVISTKVGNAVARNRLRRRLREILRARPDRLPAGDLVVRALPGAAELPSARLAELVDEALNSGARR